MIQYRAPELILYEDPEILVVHKPPGLPVQSAKTGFMDLESLFRNYLAERDPGKLPYLGVVHRLDQPVEGVLTFAKTRRAAAELSRQMQAGEMEKEYLAVTAGRPVSLQSPGEDKTRETELADFLLKDGKTNTSRVVMPGTPGAKKAVLFYQVLENAEGHLLLKIRLQTGRHHQIRVQMAHAGMPLLGDRKYGTPVPAGHNDFLALCAFRLTFRHPSDHKKKIFMIRPTGEGFGAFSLSSL